MYLTLRLSRALALVMLLSSAFLLAGCGCNSDDNDGDGFTQEEGDCDDNQALIYPGAFESCNGLDDDCDNSIDEDFDADSDGHFDADACTDGTDCDDDDPAFNPDAIEPDIDFDNCPTFGTFLLHDLTHGGELIDVVNTDNRVGDFREGC